jgi:hypothetical protein
LLYTHIVFLITLYATSGRNASDAPPMKPDGPSSGAIELTATPTTRTRTASRGAWYSRVRTEEPERHVIGNDDEDED